MPQLQKTEMPGRLSHQYADSVIISVSQRPKNKLVQTTEGLKANADGRLIADEKGNTTSAGIFAAGDVVNGAKTVVEAVAYSKIVAESMDEYMRSVSALPDFRKRPDEARQLKSTPDRSLLPIFFARQIR